MNVLLIQPYKIDCPVGLPMGLCQISAVLKEYGHTVTGLDMAFSSDELFIKRVRETEIIGLSITTRTFKESIRLARLAKQTNPNCIIIAGGPHPTLRPHEVIADDSIDYCVVGEGEITIYELIRALELKHPINLVKGLVYRHNDKIISTGTRKFISNLDIYPFPDRDLFGIARYGSPLFYATPVMESRSCPYNCTNCQPALKRIAGPYRVRSVHNVMAELEVLYYKYGIHNIFFQGNDMSVKRRWFINLMNALQESDMGLRWSGTMRINHLDYKILRLMKDSRCYEFFVGIESGSQRVIDEVLNKKIDIERSKLTLSNADTLELQYHLYLMIGIPGETQQEMLDTVEFALTSNANSILVNIGKVIPDIQWNQMIKDNEWSIDTRYHHDDIPETRSLITTDQWSPLFVEEVKQKLIDGFERRGWRKDPDTLLFFNTKKNARQKFLLTVGGSALRFIKFPSRTNGRDFVDTIRYKVRR